MSARRLLVVAAAFHVALAALLFTAGRLQLAPSVIDRNGILAAAPDSAYYLQHATVPGAWRVAAERPHVRLFSLVLTFAGPFLGYGVLGAEPLNLATYLAIVVLVFVIAREAGGERAGLIAAAVVATWPTLVLHTVQLLKDPLFIALSLGVVLTVVTWLTRVYDRRHAAGAAVGVIVAASLLLFIRIKFAVVVFALIAFGVFLLLVRQLLEKRLLAGNIACALIVLAASGVMLARSERTIVRVKSWPSHVRGPSKTLETGPVAMRAIVVAESATPLGDARARFTENAVAHGSEIDDDVKLHDARDIIAYLPRAAAIGLWAPFPSMWTQPGQLVGRTGRVLAAVETAAMYVIELLALAAVVLRPRRLPSLLLVVIALFGVTILGIVVSNVGTLYRFRYLFWILLIIAGASGAEKLLRMRRRIAIATIAIATLLLSSCAGSGRGDLTITNRSGAKIRALYLSPSDAPTWEENVLGGDVLRDGDTVVIRFDARTRTTLWDLRVDGSVRRAEWKRLDATKIAAITIQATPSVVIANVRSR